MSEFDMLQKVCGDFHGSGMKHVLVIVNKICPIKDDLTAF